MKFTLEIINSPNTSSEIIDEVVHLLKNDIPMLATFYLGEDEIEHKDGDNVIIIKGDYILILTLLDDLTKKKSNLNYSNKPSMTDNVTPRFLVVHPESYSKR